MGSAEEQPDTCWDNQLIWINVSLSPLCRYSSLLTQDRQLVSPQPSVFVRVRYAHWRLCSCRLTGHPLCCPSGLLWRSSSVRCVLWAGQQARGTAQDGHLLRVCPSHRHSLCGNLALPPYRTKHLSRTRAYVYFTKSNLHQPGSALLLPCVRARSP